MFKYIFFNSNFYFTLRQFILLGLPAFIFTCLNKNYNFFFSFIPTCFLYINIDNINIFYIEKIIVTSFVFTMLIVIIQIFYYYKISFIIYFFILNILLSILSEIFPLYNKIFLGCLLISIFFFNLLLKFNFLYISIICFVSIWCYAIVIFFWSYLFRNYFIRENIFILYKELSLVFSKKYLLILKDDVDYNNLLYHKKIMDLFILIYEQIDVLYFFNEEKKILIKYFNIACLLRDNIFVNININKNFYLNNIFLNFYKKNIFLISKKILNIGYSILYRKYINYKKLYDENIKNFNNNLYKYKNIFNILYLRNIINIFINKIFIFKEKIYINNISYIYNNKFICFCLPGYINNYKNFLKFNILFNIFFIFFKKYYLDEYYWILLSLVYLHQNSFTNILIKIYNRLLGIFLGVILSYFLIKLNLSKYIYLLIILLLSITNFYFIKNNYILSVVGFTLLSILNYNLLYIDILKYFYLRVLDVVNSSIISVIGNIILWTQWDINVFKKNMKFIMKIYKKFFYIRINIYNFDFIYNKHYKFLFNQIHNVIFSNYINFKNDYIYNYSYYVKIYLWIFNNYLFLENINSIFILVNNYISNKNILVMLNILHKYIYLSIKFNSNRYFNIYYNLYIKKFNFLKLNYYEYFFLKYILKSIKYIKYLIYLYKNLY